MINPKLPNLVSVLGSLVEEMGGYVTKTKLLKLLYLFDVEYFRVYRQIYTGFNWQYFHLGPWTSEYDPILEDLLAKGILQKSSSAYADHDTDFYKAVKKVPIREALPNSQDEYILRRILNIWADKRTAQILDYVYFQTEPILLGERYRPLDFSVIPEHAIPQYRRTSSGKTKQEIKAARKAFEENQKTKVSAPTQPATFIPPKYDDEYWEAMDTLEELAR
jgi:hypothetical protein